MRLLLLAKLIYRTSVHVITKKISFFANKGFEANIISEKQLFKKFVYSADIAIKKIGTIHKELKKNIKFFNIYIKKYADTLKIRKPILKKKNKVYLL